VEVYKKQSNSKKNLMNKVWIKKFLRYLIKSTKLWSNVKRNGLDSK
jgi:hypothetical protein